MVVPIVAPSAAFRAGSCQDVVEEILLWIPSYRYSPWNIMNDSSSELQSLARCARVSHMFHESAVKILWEDLEDWRPVLCVLYKSIEMRSNLQQANLYGPIEDDQWARIEFHASLVKRIHKLDEIDLMFGPAFWALITRARGKPIFPNLRRVDRITTHHITLGPLSLIPPTLTKVSILVCRKGEEHGCKAGCCEFDWPDYDTNPLNGVGAALHIQVPSLTSLSIRFDFDPHDVGPEDLRSLAAFRSLEHLDIACSSAETSWPAIHRLCLVLPRLRSLGISFEDYQPSIEDSEEAVLRSAPPLASLTYLHLQANMLDAAVVLRSVANSALQTLSMQGSSSSEAWLRALDVVVSLFSVTLTRALLRPLSVWNGEPTILSFLPFAERIEGLKHLQCLVFGRAPKRVSDRDYDAVFDYGGESLRRLATALPHLRKLAILPHLHFDRFSPPRPQTLRTIQTFAVNCPDMELLFLPLGDSSELDAWYPTGDVEPQINMSRVGFFGRLDWETEVKDRLTQYVMQIYANVRQVEFLERWILDEGLGTDC